MQVQGLSGARLWRSEVELTNIASSYTADIPGLADRQELGGAGTRKPYLIASSRTGCYRRSCRQRCRVQLGGITWCWTHDCQRDSKIQNDYLVKELKVNKQSAPRQDICHSRALGEPWRELT